MIYTDDISKFYTIISDLEASGALVRLYGQSEETGPSTYSGSDVPPNTKTHTRIVALTSVGTIFCNSVIRLTENEAVATCKSILDKLNVKDAEVSYSQTNGTVTIK